MTEVQEALDSFAAALTRNFSAAEVNPAQAEDQLKGPVQELLQGIGKSFDRTVVARTEARSDFDVRPDVGVSVDGLLAGHVELKAPGKGARANALRDRHDREQFKRLKDHPNLVYTDGNEWALYRRGELVGSLVRAEGDVRSDGASAYGEASARGVEQLLRDFFTWEPLVPSSPKALAELLAPLTRLLRENVRAALADPNSALAELATEWRRYFFPDADDAQFADAYAQTVTYALLLARVEGEEDLHARAAERLQERHALLAQVLRVIEEPAARAEVEVAIGLLERIIAAVDPESLARRAQHQDLWLYFYEDFLAAYDPTLRRQRGVYFTPPSVVRAQTTLVSELLKEKFAKPLGFADDEVTVLDPGVGTGTYLLGAIDSGLAQVRASFGEGAVAARASVMAENFHGFELLIGSYAVAHLRVSRRILELGGQLPADGPHVYLTDTLESPHLAPPGLADAPLFHRPLAEENERARRVKTEVPVLVCIGNPPYFRQVIEPGEEGVERLGGWVRRGDEGHDGILNDFLRNTPGVHAKNLYNLYVYFWRWALWKVFENAPRRGVISFISASSYLRGPGFVGMRRYMREMLDEIWILDLGGEGRGARMSENVFDIQTPVAIAVGVRYGEPDPDKPARAHYSRIEGTRQGKYAALDAIDSFNAVAWQECFSGWTDPFLPDGETDFYSWALLTDIFPWQHSGVQFKRTWPIAPDRAVLVERWRALVSASPDDRGRLARETSDRSIDRAYRSFIDDAPLPAIKELAPDTPPPAAIPYGYRTLDRQFCLPDNRLCSRPRPPLWRSSSARQLYMTSLLTGLLGGGPAASLSRLVPDLDYFRGSFGAKHVVPLWRDAECTSPNVTSGLLDAIATRLDLEISAENLFAYAYAILCAPEYVERFAEELEVPGPRVPITADRELFERGIELGQRLIWLHTYGERFVPEGSRVAQVPQGRARCTDEVGTSPDDYPERHEYKEGEQELRVGKGVFAPVSPAVRHYSVSGLDVIGSWLDYRMREGAGRQSSPLDHIRPTIWPAAFTEEFLRLLWIVEHTLDLQPDLNGLLENIIEAPVIKEEELPAPAAEERAPPP